MSKIEEITKMALTSEKRQLLNTAHHRSSTPEEQAECEARIREINEYIESRWPRQR